LEQVAVLTNLKNHAVAIMEWQTSRARQEGRSVPMVDYSSYVDIFGDALDASWDPSDTVALVLDPRVTTFCLAMERERRKLMEIEPIPSDPDDLDRMAREALSALFGFERMVQSSIAMMAHNERSGWTMRYVRNPDGGDPFVFDEPEVESKSNGMDPVRWVATDWTELSSGEKQRVLAEMERIGKQAGWEDAQSDVKAAAPYREFLQLFGNLVPPPGHAYEHALAMMDPRVTTFCLALETERRSELGEPPLPVEAATLEPLIKAANRRRAAAEECLERRLRSIPDAPASDTFCMFAVPLIRRCPEIVGEEVDWARIDTELSDEPEGQTVIAAMERDDDLRRAAVRYERALSHLTRLSWAFNKATGWRLWSEQQKAMSNAQVRGYLEAILPGGAASQMIRTDENSVPGPVDRGRPGAGRQVLDEPMSPEEFWGLLRRKDDTVQ
jgi:hypothetical protein